MGLYEFNNEIICEKAVNIFNIFKITPILDALLSRVQELTAWLLLDSLASAFGLRFMFS